MLHARCKIDETKMKPFYTPYIRIKKDCENLKENVLVLKRKTISLGGSVRKQFQQNLKIRNTFVIIVAALMNSAYICTTN